MSGSYKCLLFNCLADVVFSRLLLLILLTFVSFCLCRCSSAEKDNEEPSLGTTYYVDGQNPEASDLNSGTEAAPWLTIQHAATVISAGDTVLVKEGVYPERIMVQNSGTPGAQITFSNYADELVVINGSMVTLPEWDGLFQVLGVNHITVQGFQIINSGPWGTSVGIQVEDSSHIVVQDNHTAYTNSSGIFVWNSSSVLIENNEVEQAMTAGEDSRNECISIGRSTDCEVCNNHVHDGNPVRGEGICIKDGTSNTIVHHNLVHDVQSVGIYLDAWTEHTFNLKVYANRVHDVAGNGIVVASEQGGLLEHIQLYNNFVWHNHYLGLNISSCCIESHPMTGLNFLNNSVWGNGLGDWGGGFAIDHDQITGLLIRNNACAGNLSFEIAAEGLDPSDWTLDHNLIDSWDGYPGELCGSDCVIGNPRWINPAAGDLHLGPDSMALDRGTSEAAPATDIDNEARPGGANFDIGADEYYPQAVPLLSMTGLIATGLCFGWLLRRHCSLK
ncbi:right-handed parallel beta-helix repeat-containing protein [bacterium]|nr:right-handed parallel beta-helix repeat-containing protein [bacterium]